MPDYIPKFRSFKPKAKATDTAASDVRSRTERRDDDERNKEASRRRHHERHDHHHVKRAQSPQDLRHDRRTENKEQGATTSDRTYAVDTVGDINNLKYGSLHKYDISQYHRKGYGTVLGLDNHLRIDRDASTHSQIVLDIHHAQDGKRPRTLARAKDLIRSHARFVKPSSTSATFSAADAYVPLSNKKKRKRDSESHTGGMPSYRGSLEADKSDKSDSDTPSSDNEIGVDIGARARQRHGELLRLAKDDPTNVETWKALIHHQAEVVAPGVDEGSFHFLQQHAVRGIRLGLYKKALTSVNKTDRRDLVNAMLNQGSHVGGVESQISHYLEALRADPLHTALWRRYMDLDQKAERATNLDLFKQGFIDNLIGLEDNRKAYMDTEAAKSLAESHIYVILRHTKFLHGLGYEELPIATWQALMEIHGFARGSQLEADIALERIKASWDDEGPRFGDIKVATAVDQVDPGDLNRDQSPILRFVAAEEKLSLARELPGRTTDEPDDVAAEDVLHVIFYGDLEDTLELAKHVFDHGAIVDGFLAFFELPPVPAPSDVEHLWQNDPALFSECFNGDDGQGFQSTMPPSFAVTMDTIWQVDIFPASLKHRIATLAFINQGLTQLVESNAHSSELSTYLLAFQATFFPEIASKTAKRLIKSRPSDLALYNAAAQIECRLGRFQKAAVMFGAAINAGKNMSMPDHGAKAAGTHKASLVRLVSSWAWTEMSLGNEKLALSRIAALRRDSVETTDEISAATLLALHDDLKTGLTTSVNHNLTSDAALYASTHLLLTYLTSATPLPAILALHATHTGLSPSEAVHQTICPLLTYHLEQHRPHRPLDLLNSLETSLALHPANTLLLNLHARLSSARAAIEPIPRSHLLLGSNSPVQAWLTALASAMRRPTAEAARSLFRRATATESACAHAPAIWAAWLAFEAKQDLDAAKRIWHLGCQAQPWSKKWILAGLKLFNGPDGMMTKGELREVYDSMMERDMRIRRESELYRMVI